MYRSGFSRLFILKLFCLAILACPAAACIWDSDTIQDELRGIPEAAILATGRWYRHGETYYRHRVKTLEDKQMLTLEEYDDLAVAIILALVFFQYRRKRLKRT